MAAFPYNVYATIPTPAPPELPGAIVRDLSDPALRPHLRGLEGWIRHRLGERPLATQWEAVEHAWRVRCQLTWTGDTRGLDAVVAWATAANGLVFTFDGVLRDLEGRPIVGPGFSPDARVPRPEAAYARRARIRARLEAAGYPIMDALRTGIAEPETALRPRAEVRRRAMGLMLVAAHADNRLHDGPLQVPDLGATFFRDAASTPREAAFLAGDGSDRHEATQMLWRYEAAATLLWALGAMEIGFPSEPLLVDDIVEAVVRLSDEDVPPSSTAILDELDRCFRLHWYVTSRRLRGEPYSDLQQSIVIERRHALAWLVGTAGFDWEDVELPT
jgi:hypothetical protein